MKKFVLLILALAMVVAFTVPTYAVTYSFKGDARMDTYSVDRSKEITGFNDSNRDTLWAKNNSLSRFSVTAKSENIKGFIEIRPNVASYVRHWFGEWDFGAGKLLVGKTWSPSFFATNGQNFLDNGIAAYGKMKWATARIDQIRLTFNDFVLGFVSPATQSDPGVPVGTFQDIETVIPTIEATYTLKLDPVKLIFVAGYATYDVNTTTNNTYSVDSYLAGLYAFFNFGPVYLNVEGHISQNGTNYGMLYAVDGSAKFASGEVKNNDGLGFLAALGYKISDMLTVEAGYAHLECEDDLPGVTADDASWMYINMPITLAPGVTISPELGKIDQGVNSANVDQGDTTYVGATWKIAF